MLKKQINNYLSDLFIYLLILVFWSRNVILTICSNVILLKNPNVSHRRIPFSLSRALRFFSSIQTSNAMLQLYHLISYHMFSFPFYFLFFFKTRIKTWYIASTHQININIYIYIYIYIYYGDSNYRVIIELWWLNSYIFK